MGTEPVITRDLSSLHTCAGITINVDTRLPALCYHIVVLLTQSQGAQIACHVT